MAIKETQWQGEGWYSIGARKLKSGAHFIRSKRDLTKMVANAGRLFGKPVRVRFIGR